MNYLHNEVLHNWLWELLVVEEQCEELFDGQADQVKMHPRIQARLEYEATRARFHQKIITTRLRQLGVNTSVFRDNFEGLIQVSPTLLKICMSNNAQEAMIALYTLTQMEITSLKIIEKIAETLTDKETSEISQTLLAQLETRAQWMSGVIKELTLGTSTSHAA